MFTQCLAPRVIFYLKTLISVTICHIKRNFFHSVSIHLSHNICRQTLFKHANSWQQKIPEEGLTAELLETNQLCWSRLEYLINECWLAGEQAEQAEHRGATVEASSESSRSWLVSINYTHSFWVRSQHQHFYWRVETHLGYLMLRLT